MVPPKLSNDPAFATNTIAIVSSTNSVKWYHSSIQFTCKVLDARKKCYFFLIIVRVFNRKKGRLVAVVYESFLVMACLNHGVQCRRSMVSRRGYSHEYDLVSFF